MAKPFGSLLIISPAEQPPGYSNGGLILSDRRGDLWLGDPEVFLGAPIQLQSRTS
jgi:hypothetical protein